jgi:hypothetical protein
MGIGLGLSGNMQINHGALQCFVPQDFLDMPYGNIGFQQMSCICMSKDMWVNMFFKAHAFQCAPQNPLDAAVADMGFCKLCIFASIATQGRKNPLNTIKGSQGVGLKGSYLKGSSRRLTYGDLLAAISGNQYHIQAQWLQLCQQCCGVNETFRKIIDCESDMKRSRMPS